MPKMTDYVRQGFKRRQRPWDQAELPEWWNLVIWAALLAVVAAVAVGAVIDRGRPPEEVSGSSRRYTVQTVNPYAPSPTSTSTTSTAPTAPTAPAQGTDGTGMDFTATAAVQVRMTKGGTIPVPAGARDLAIAAARAMATGDWAGIPLIGAVTPSPAPPTPTGSVVGEVTVTDPRVTGNSRYLFSASIRHDPNAKPYPVEIAVERAGSGYAVRLR
jgi:hypothetical protein